LKDQRTADIFPGRLAMRNLGAELGRIELTGLPLARGLLGQLGVQIELDIVAIKTE
jgi:hypothetical protein